MRFESRRTKHCRTHNEEFHLDRLEWLGRVQRQLLRAGRRQEEVARLCSSCEETLLLFQSPLRDLRSIHKVSTHRRGGGHGKADNIREVARNFVV